MKRKAEMKVGNLMVAGMWETKKDKDTKLWRWRFSYDDDETRYKGMHVFGDFATEDDCKTNAKIMGVEFSK